jgi:hypothetical protein
MKSNFWKGCLQGCIIADLVIYLLSALGVFDARDTTFLEIVVCAAALAVVKAIENKH